MDDDGRGGSVWRDSGNVHSALPRLLRRQLGVISRRQALQLGHSRHQLDHLVESGRWQKVLPGVYATFSGRVDDEQRLHAAVLWGARQSVPTQPMLTGAPALRLQGSRYADDPRPHLLLPHEVKPKTPAGLIVTRARHLPTPYHRHGLPVAPAHRAAVDAALVVTTLRETRALLCAAVQQRLTTLPALTEEVTARHDSRLTLTRRVLSDLGAGCRSAPECEARDLFLTSEVLPPPLCNAELRLGDEHYVVDDLWPEARLVAEVDSLEHHGVGALADATARRRAHLTGAGYAVIDISPWRLRTEPADVLLQVERAYLHRLRLPA